MRKIKLFLSLLMVMLLNIGQMWAVDVSFDFSTMGSTGWTSDYVQHSTTCTDGTVTFTSANQNTQTITDIPVTKGQPVSFVLSDGTKSLSAVSFTCRQWGSKAQTITLHYSTNSGSTYTSTEITSTNFSISSSSLPTGTNAVKITFSSTSNQVGIESMSYTLAAPQQQTIPVASVTLDESAITLNEDETQELNATVLPANASNKNVTWTSDDKDVATVVDGVVTAVGAGDAVITCTSVADNSKLATCNVHVNSPYTKSKLIFEDEYKDSGATADDGAEWTVTSDGAESVYDGTSGIHYGTNNANVTYVQLATSDITGEVAKVVVNARDAQATATISVTVGGTAFTCASATATNTSADYVFTGTGSGEIVVRVDRGSSMSKAIYVKSVVVSYTPAAVEVKKPTFSVEAGSYLEAQSVELNCTTTGADIYYTLNGDDPDENSTHYEGAIQVSTTTTIKAIAILGTTSSPIATATYTIINTAHAGTAEDPYSVADAKAVIDGIGTKADAYVSGKISQVDSYSDQYKSITYWISADGTTANQLQVYSGKGIGGANFSSVDDVVAKAAVVVKGTLKKHYDIYEFDYNNELVSYEAPAEPIVTLSPSSLNLEAEGNGTQEITLTATNFENEVNEIICAFYNTAACDDEAISQPAWITNLTVNNSNQVSFDVADNEGEARQVWMKVVASDGSNSAFAVLTISQAKYTVDYAELPFEFDGGRADIASKQGMSQEGLGSDYNNSPKLKFDGTGDWVIVEINSDPGKLTYDIIGNGFSGGTFTVQQSANGTVYTDVVAYTELGAKSSKEETLAQETRFVKFIYTEKVSGNVALGNIAIAEYVAPAAVEAPTFSLEEGAYLGTQSVTLACETDGATIYYTEGENPADPTSASTEYTGAISVEQTTTIKAIAIKGSDESAVASATYTIVTLEHAGTVDDPYTVADARTAIDAGIGITNVYATGIVSEIVTAYNSQYGNISYNISADGETSSDQLQAFRGKNKNGDWFTSDADVQVGDIVIIYGNLTKYGETYEFGQDNQRYSFQRPGDPVLQSIAISEGPSKTTYDVGDVFDVTGLVVTGTYDQGAPAEITAGITWEVRTNSTSDAVALASYALTQGQTALQVRATVGEVVSEWFDVIDLTVKEHEITPGAYDITLANALWGTSYTSTTTSTSANALDLSGGSNDIQVNLTNGTSTNMYITDDGTRAYSGYTLTFAVPTGYNITKITFTKASKWGLSAASGLNSNANEWTGKANSVSFSFTARTDMTTVEVTFAEVVPEAVATPTFSLAAGAYTGEQTVTISCETDGATIYYTTDGTDPDNTSNEYTGAITVDESKTIKAIAYNGEDHSDVATAAYTINQPEDETNGKTWNLTVASYVADPAPTTELIQWTATYVSMKNERNGNSNTAVNNYIPTTQTSTRFYKNNKLTITPNDKEITSVVFTATTTGYATALATSTWTNATATVNNTTITVSPTDGESAISAVIGATCGFTSVQVNYKEITPEQPGEPNYKTIRTGLNAGEYYTMCLNKAVEAFRGGSVWRVVSKDQNDIDVILEEVTNTKAGRPYIFFATATKFEVAYTGDAVTEPVNDADNNGLIGSFSQVQVPNVNTNYIIYNNALYYVDGTNVYVGANRAYLDMTGVPAYSEPQQLGNAPRRRVTMTVHGEQTTTGIENAQGDQVQSAKVLINGQLFIIRGEKMYNVNGQLVK